MRQWLVDVLLEFDDLVRVFVRHQQVAVGEEHTFLHESALDTHSVSRAHGVSARTYPLHQDRVV